MNLILIKISFDKEMSKDQSQQPDPVNKGRNVPEAFQKWASANGHEEACELSKIRDSFGQSKYGQPLMSEDGRDTIQDVIEEIGDMLHYLYKAKMNGENIDKIRPYIPTINDLVNEFE